MTKSNDYYQAPDADFLAEKDPWSLFKRWMADAERHEPNDPNAMAVASIDENGMPNLRMVLLKSYDAQGLVFYTNLNSAKGKDLAANQKAAVLFHWKSIRRQVRMRGRVARVSDAEADAYFASRPREARIGAWASQQSQPLESRMALERAVAKYALKYNLKEVPRPEYWSGFRVQPLQIEFWHDRPFRLHDRLLFSREAVDVAWQQQMLYP